MQELENLIRKAQKGDLSAFDAIVQRFRDMAVGYAYSVLGDFHLAEDAAQEAFVQAYRDLKKLRKPQAFSSWFRRIVFKYCDRITRKKLHSTIPFETIVEPADSSRSPVEIIQKKEDQDAVLDGIKALPEHERVATALFYIDGYSMAEVGDFLEMPLGTVKSSLHSARKRLKERMVEMVEETLKSHAPGKDFNDRIRRVLEKVPVITFQLHQKKETSGIRRCPESMAFPSCLRSYLEYVGDDMGYKKITIHNKDWRLDTTYVYLMGTTGSAFRLSWKSGWYMGNPAIVLISDDSFAPYRRGMESVGYAYEMADKEEKRIKEEHFRKKIIESIQEKRHPVIANGVVGPPVDCLITGFDEEGDVLIGWSFFQGAREFSADLEFEPSGYFRKRNWFKDTQRLVIIGKKKGRPSKEKIYKDTLEWAIKIIRTPIVHGDCHSGLAAYEAWAEAILQDEEFADKKVKELMHRYHVHQDASGMVAEGRWYAYQFLQKVTEDVSCPKEEVSQAAQCFDEEHSLMWQLWSLVGGPGASAEKAKTFKDPEVRRKSADIILKAREQDQRAADCLKRALKMW
ncbi:MAG: RNA polymerase sigma factor [Candidatus Aminicenantes bacterium]|nr:MAG: RNA polymerase sigma factor [Candidatus Aminicenantes bacterium]